ncbi:MFS transporter [Lichenicoccus roseus]|uniref:Acyl-[ACP]--phospholipid O-acyltransferase n=1 Tax=Lichenicoccus roseus TaxID=2683649 RepID=A0A5R9J8V4_9PROT|nr:MFS transporter [Lichenicoccus roseus]TLU70648.1 acyl-[ACP]--phospholipid O-acyltransferase [Lichenicoccus roseus]
MSQLLLTDRRFRPVFLSQFFSALGDNLLRNTLAALALFAVAGSSWMVAAATAAFVAPAAVLSGLGGELADRMDKARLIRALRLAEMLVAMVAAMGLVTGHLPVVLGALAAAGVIAALFGPVKYGILPDQLAAYRLPGANALVEGATFAAILIGSVGGSMLVSLQTGPGLAAIMILAAAALSWLSARGILSTVPAAPGLQVRVNLIASSWHLLRDLRAERRSWRAALANAWFWMSGAAVLTLLPGFVRDALGGSAALNGLFLGVFAVGIAAGSGLAASLAGGRVVLATASIGCVLLGGALLEVWHLAHVSTQPAPLAELCLSLFAAAAGAGLIAVPTQAAIQSWAAPSRRARAVGAMNVLSALGMVLSSVALIVAQAEGLEAVTLLGITGLLSLLLAPVMLLVLPANPVGDILWMLYRLLFRIEVKGLEHLPRPGEAALITPNHLSWLDAGLVMAIAEHRPLFVVDAQVARLWWVRPALRLVSWLPVDSAGPQSLKTMIAAVSAGNAMVIFPEGRLSVTGSLMEILPGTGTVADKAHAVVVPVHHQGLERTPFSRLDRSQTRRSLLPKVRVTVFPARPLEVADDLVGRARRLALTEALRDAMEEAVYLDRLSDDTLFEAVARAARRHGMGRLATQDPVSGALSYRKLLAGIDVLGGKISLGTEKREIVGLLLPTSNAAAVCLLGLSSYGRTAAMMNATAGLRGLRAAIQAARIRTVVTSRTFVAKARLSQVIDDLHQDVRVIYLEDVRATVTRRDRISGLLRAMFHTATPRVACAADDQAVVVFTSGSSGTPKGVVLSHRNLLSNVAQVAGRIGFGRDDKVLNALPMFHAFGLMGGFLLPVINGIPVFLYPSPLHYSTVPVIAYNWNATAIFGTSVFYNGYARRATPSAFRSLRLVVAGAARVAPAVRELWMEKFGLRILEGYGVTECSPVVAVNTPASNRSGTVGRLLPGMQMRLEHIPGRDDAGRLVVQGPNVMLGYLKADQPGVLQRPQDGWYDTGDIVSLDQAGHLRIHGRLTRTARPGGEMVSLEAIEDIAADLWRDAMSVAVTVPDPRKDERVVLLTDKTGAVRDDFVARARSLGAPEVMLPAEVRVLGKLPLLGAGKPDYMAATRLVLEDHPLKVDRV